jgi:hypothetical protein
MQNRKTAKLPQEPDLFHLPARWIVQPVKYFRLPIMLFKNAEVVLILILHNL